MCSPSLRARLAADPYAASALPTEAAVPPARNLGVALAAFRPPPQSVGPATQPVSDIVSSPIPLTAPAAPRTPLPSLETLASLNAQAKMEAQQASPPVRAPSPALAPPPPRHRPAAARPRIGMAPDILAGSRYDGLRGKDLDSALEDSHRRQQAIDAQAEWNATLGRITRDYQTPDDPGGMVYVPRTPRSPFDLGVVTARERRLISQLPIRAGVDGVGQFFRIREHAVNMTGSFIGLPSREQVPPKVRDYILRTYPAEKYNAYVDLWRNTDGHSDAFRHAYWNALMSKAFGPVFAQSYGTAHEGGPNSPRVSEAMDLYNNEVGRRIAEDHPDASEQQLAGLVRDALRRGKLVVIDQNGRLAWSDKVKWAEHGLTPSTAGNTGAGRMRPIDGETYHP